MNTDQIAAEAADQVKWRDEQQRALVISCIKSAIEKATEELREDLKSCLDRRMELQLKLDESRAAHASERCTCGDEIEPPSVDCPIHYPRNTSGGIPAHASEQGAIAKLLSALREIASYDLNCAHETIAQAAIEDYEKSQRPTPAASELDPTSFVPIEDQVELAKPDSASTGNPQCPTCGQRVPDSLLGKIVDAVMEPATTATDTDKGEEK